MTAILVWLGSAAIGAVAIIGKERKPLDNRFAVYAIVQYGLVAWGIIFLARG